MGALADGRRVVTTAGTSVALSATSVSVSSVAITAETDNTGVVVVGGVGTVVAALATRRGVPLSAGDTLTLGRADQVDDLAEVGLDATVSGDGVTFVYGVPS
jgi:hypothetical protein